MGPDELPGSVKGVALLVIGLTIGGAGGYALKRAPTPAPTIAHDHSKHAHTEGEHAHGDTWEWSGQGDPPSVEIMLHPDPQSGWGLQVKTENFRFTPEASGMVNTAGQGHGHLYVNGDKIARLYGPWFHLETLPAGKNEITVTLNTNDHQTITVGGLPLEARTTVTVE